MRNSDYILPGLVLSLIPCSLSCKSAKEKSPLNELFIAVDDLRPELACYGDPLAITPNIVNLAKNGVLFKRHYVQKEI